MTSRPRALRVALTGGIATGKSYCLKRFTDLGAPVVDADALAHAALAPGTPGAAEAMARFGTLDRARLARLIFNDADARRALEAIVHPRVYERIEAWFRGLKTSAPFGIADIPLLFESGHERDFDRVIITSCTPAEQRARLSARGLTAADADARIASQMPIDDKLSRAKAARIAVDIIDTSGTLASTDAEVTRLFEQLASVPPKTCS